MSCPRTSTAGFCQVFLRGVAKAPVRKLRLMAGPHFFLRRDYIVGTVAFFVVNEAGELIL